MLKHDMSDCTAPKSSMSIFSLCFRSLTFFVNVSRCVRCPLTSTTVIVKGHDSNCFELTRERIALQKKSQQFKDACERVIKTATEKESDLTTKLNNANEDLERAEARCAEQEEELKAHRATILKLGNPGRSSFLHETAASNVCKEEEQGEEEEALGRGLRKKRKSEVV